MKKILKNKKGFTLIELIVVIAIIAILAAIAIPTFSGVMNDAKKANVISIAKNANTLAQVEILNNQIDGGTAISGTWTTDSNDVLTDAGADGDGDSIVIANDIITSIIILEDGIEVTYENGEYKVTE